MMLNGCLKSLDDIFERLVAMTGSRVSIFNRMKNLGAQIRLSTQKNPAGVLLLRQAEIGFMRMDEI